MPPQKLPDIHLALFEGFAKISSESEGETLLGAARALPMGIPRIAEGSLVDPNSFRSRVEDSCRLTPDEVERSVTIHYSEDQESSGSDQHVVCLVRPVKGRTLRGFRAQGRTGASLRALGLRERREVVLRILLKALDEAASALVLRDRERARLELSFAHLVLCEPTIDSRRRRQEFEDHVVAALGGLMAGKDQRSLDNSAVSRLLRVSAIAASRDPVMVEVGVEDSGRVTYTQLDLYGPRTTSERTATHPRWERLSGGLSRALGVIPNKIYLPTYKMAFAADYSLEVIAPPGNYLANASKEDASYVSRGVGTHRMTMTPSARASPNPAIRQTHVGVMVRQRPSEAMLRSMALALLVTGVSIAVLVSAPRFDEDIRLTTALEVLSWSTGIASIALVAVWAVLRHKSQETAFEPGAILSACMSAAVLIALIMVLATSPSAYCSLIVPAIASIANLGMIGVGFFRRLVNLATTLAADAAIDLEGPRI